MPNGHCTNTVNKCCGYLSTKKTFIFRNAAPILGLLLIYDEKPIGSGPTESRYVNPGDIVIARDLSPSDMASLVNSGVAGFVTEVGGQTSHTAIMARSIELPAVVAVDGLTERIATGDHLIVDASRGAVLVNPPESEIARLKALASEYTARKADIDAHSHEKSATLDGAEIAVWGNIESSDEAKVILEHGASGVGLYRTEYLFIGRRTMPDEEEQYEHTLKCSKRWGTAMLRYARSTWG